MPSQYNLNIKAKLDTSQVQQALKNLKLPGNGGGGGGPGGGGNGSANKEIEDAAKKVNLGALAGGFNRLTGTLNSLSSNMTGAGQKLIQTFSEVTSTTASAITNIRSFGPAVGTAITALELFAKAVGASTEQRRKGATGLADLAYQEGAEERAKNMAEAKANISGYGLDSARRELAKLEAETADKRTERNEARDELRMALEHMAGGGKGAESWVRTARANYDTKQNALSFNEEVIDHLRAKIKELEEAEERAAEEAERTSRAFLEQSEATHEAGESLKANRAEELRQRGILESGDATAMGEELSRVNGVIAELEGLFTLSKDQQAQLAEAYRQQDFWTNAIKDVTPGPETPTDKEEEEKRKEIPSWLDGFEDRTNDFFHGIGGSLGGENSLQNDEYRVLQEMERLLRESTGYARQTAQSVA